MAHNMDVTTDLWVIDAERLDFVQWQQNFQKEYLVLLF
jgi:hypothetical protein